MLDYLVIGGGPAGLATAIHAALSGQKALVIERHRGPVDKACGDCLFPGTLAHLQRMGVQLPAGFALPGLSYHEGEFSAEADFMEGPAMGLPRTLLSEALRERALQLGVEIREGVEALEWTETREFVSLLTTRGAVRGNYLVGADGLHSLVRARTSFPLRTEKRRYFGIRKQLSVAPWSDRLQVWWGPGVWASVTPTGPNSVTLSYLWSRADGNEALFRTFFPELAKKLPEEGEMRGSGPLPVQVETPVRDRIFLVGDAAGYRESFLGAGLARAFASAEAMVSAGGKPEHYEKAWKALSGDRLARLWLWMGGRPWWRRRLVRALFRHPLAFRSLLGVQTGAYTWTQALPSMGRLSIGMLSG